MGRAPTAESNRSRVPHLTAAERAARGKAARSEAPRRAHGDWEPAPARPDPVAVLEEQARARVPELVPIRYGRMLASPFAFFRGAAAIMAADLADGPRTGLQTQLCGDAHLSNFGIFATPDRGLDVRRQRFRRDAAGAVRVGPQAPRRQLRRRRSRPRLRPQGTGASVRASSFARTARPFGSSHPSARSSSGMRASTSTGSRVPSRSRHPRRTQATRTRSREGPDEGQSQGAREADPPRSGGATDRRRPAARRSARRAHRGRATRRLARGSSRADPRVPPDSPGRPTAAAGAVPTTSTPRTRWSASAASEPEPGSS